jgi:hypothetical protein
MIEPAAFEVMSDKVLVFGRTALPKGHYAGAVEWMEIKLQGQTRRQMIRALVQVDRGLLERLGENIVPNLESVDFDLKNYVSSGDVQIVN